MLQLNEEKIYFPSINKSLSPEIYNFILEKSPSEDFINDFVNFFSYSIIEEFINFNESLPHQFKTIIQNYIFKNFPSNYNPNYFKILKNQIKNKLTKLNDNFLKNESDFFEKFLKWFYFNIDDSIIYSFLSAEFYEQFKIPFPTFNYPTKMKLFSFQEGDTEYEEYYFWIYFPILSMTDVEVKNSSLYEKKKEIILKRLFSTNKLNSYLIKKIISKFKLDNLNEIYYQNLPLYVSHSQTTKEYEKPKYFEIEIKEEDEKALFPQLKENSNQNQTTNTHKYLKTLLNTNLRYKSTYLNNIQLNSTNTIFLIQNSLQLSNKIIRLSNIEFLKENKLLFKLTEKITKKKYLLFHTPLGLYSYQKFIFPFSESIFFNFLLIDCLFQNKDPFFYFDLIFQENTDYMNNLKYFRKEHFINNENDFLFPLKNKEKKEQFPVTIHLFYNFLNTKCIKLYKNYQNLDLLFQEFTKDYEIIYKLKFPQNTIQVQTKNYFLYDMFSFALIKLIDNNRGQKRDIKKIYYEDYLPNLTNNRK